MPGDVNVIRETARMVEGWRGPECARSIYCEGEAAVAQQSREVAKLAASAAWIRGESTASGQGDAPQEPSGFVTPEQLLAADYRARYLRGWRSHQALGAYERLIDLEPSNEAALFDLGQCQSTLNRTSCAVEAYERLLDTNPCHEDAAIALQRALLEMRPKVFASFDFEDQRGRDGLANITWYNITASVRQPLGDENELLELGYRQRFLQPSDDRIDVGEISFARWQKKYQTDTLVFAELAVEQYQYGLATRPTFNAGVDVLTASDAEIRFYGFLKNYFVCGEAIRQDIYTAGVQHDAIYCPARLWTLAGTYRWASFSDDNSVNWFNVDSAHVLWEGRTQLRGLIDFTYYSFAQQTIFGPDPDSLAGTIHPYWSPSGYSFTSAGLELKQILSCDTFKGANEHYWTLFGGGGVDSNGVGYILGTCRLQKDITSRLTWTLDTNLIRSPNEIYNAVGAAMYGVVRW